MIQKLDKRPDGIFMDQIDPIFVLLTDEEGFETPSNWESCLEKGNYLGKF